MEEIIWETTVNNQAIEIKVRTKQSTRRDHAIKLVQVVIGKYVYCFVVKIVNKGRRSRELNCFNLVPGRVNDNGISFLVNEINIRTQYDAPGLCKLMAVRDSDAFTFLFEELCDLGVAMRNDNDTYIREKKTLELRAIVEKYQKRSIQYNGEPNDALYSEDEARYIIWHIFHSLLDLHNSQICHLDIRPDNIYFTSEGEVKLGGLCFISNFRNDMFGGLRSNLPGRKEFLLPEYWQGNKVSCYAADIWATVSSLYVMVKGKDPFPIVRLDTYMDKMCHYSRLPEMDGLSAELQDLLKQCFNPQTARRPTIEKILKLPWFTNYGYQQCNLRSCISCHIIPTISTQESAIPTKWTSQDMESLNAVIDSCFGKIMSVIYGGMEQLEKSVTFHYQNDDEDKTAMEKLHTVPSKEAIRLISGKHLQTKQATQDVPIALPKTGKVKYKSNDSCFLCWKTTEMYVERGKLVIGGLRNKKSKVYSILDITNIIFDESDPNVFKISWKNGEVYCFKTCQKNDAANWYNAINLSISLCQVNLW